MKPWPSIPSMGVPISSPKARCGKSFTTTPPISRRGNTPLPPPSQSEDSGSLADLRMLVEVAPTLLTPLSSAERPSLSRVFSRSITEAVSPVSRSIVSLSPPTSSSTR